MTFDSTFTSNDNDNTTSLRKKVVVGGAIALLLGVATYSSNGAANGRGRYNTWGNKNLLRSTQGTHTATFTDTDVAFACGTIKTQVDAAIGNINKELKALPETLTLEKDAVFQKEDVPLDNKGCRGDITITVSKDSSVSGLRDTTLAFSEQACSLNLFLALSGTWTLSSESPEYAVDATVSTKSTNCDIDNSGSVTITVQKPTSSAKASVAARVSLSPVGANIQKVTLDEVMVGFVGADVKLTPPGEGKSYSKAEADAITDAINKHVVPEVNKFIADRNPTSIALTDINTPKKAKNFILAWFANK